MPKPGETPGCRCGGAGYIRWRDGWVAELMTSLTSRFVTSRYVPVAYCPRCGEWLAVLDVASASLKGGDG